MGTEELYGLYLESGCKVSTDSRNIPQGAIFFALRGESFDGNDYALKALEAGASRAVVNADAALPDDARLIRVADPFTALQELAVWHRTHLRTPQGQPLPVIGLTGTNGKTTTKELIAAALGAKYKVAATKGNLNNDIGVPLTLLSILPGTEIAVVEMGANHPDDIAKLVKVSQPDFGYITNIGKAHLQGFGSYEGVLAAKTELYKWLGSRRGSVIFLNGGHADLARVASAQPCHSWEWSRESLGVEILPATADNPFLALSLILPGSEKRTEVHTKLVGSYNTDNVLAALAISQYFGVPAGDAVAAVEAYTPSNQRSQLLRTGRNTVIVDAYNANPSSMGLALDNLAALQYPRKLALLGDMRELGLDSVSEHAEILKKLSSYGIEAYLVGEEFGKALSGASGCSVILGHFPDSDALAAYLAEHPVNGAAILLKGSRGIRMEKVLPEL